MNYVFVIDETFWISYFLQLSREYTDLLCYQNKYFIDFYINVMDSN